MPTNTQSKPTYAQAAQASQASQATQNTLGPYGQALAEPKPTTTRPLKAKLVERRVILIQNTPLLAKGPIPGFVLSEIRNSFNKVFNNKGITELVVAIIARSRTGNIVITTTIAFNADYLLNKEDL
jgi:hypothetical protein